MYMIWMSWVQKEASFLQVLFFLVGSAFCFSQTPESTSQQIELHTQKAQAFSAGKETRPRDS